MSKVLLEINIIGVYSSSTERHIELLTLQFSLTPLLEFMGDLSLALDPHPPPETPTVTESLELSVREGPGEGEEGRDVTDVTEQAEDSGLPSRYPQGLDSKEKDGKTPGRLYTPWYTTVRHSGHINEVRGREGERVREIDIYSK